ncbi:MAG TPA: PKD domain-containing protein [Solirubrobacteraceae bacterium]|nr:PKD domain-containing protein [Solirubrobacteraceae bacterium]
MKAVCGGRRARWLLCAVLAATPFVVAMAFGAPARPAATSERPIIDTGYLYSQLYGMATSDVYRVSGADGPPQDPSSSFNVPSTVNGWQELIAHWKGELTSTHSMGPIANFATAKDHFFRRSGGYRFDSNDAEVTIPGASCAGQRVLLAAHPDNVPVPTSVVQNIDSGNATGDVSFGTARRQITLSNLGNGGAYDGTSGVAMTMAEYQALLRWYAANGTWPKRTLKITLLDAHQDRPLSPADEGAKHYADDLIPRGPQGRYVLFANMDMNGLEYPAFHWGTDHYLNDVANGGVGPWFTNIAASPLAANDVYPDSGSDSAWARIQANLPAVQAFRDALQSSVTDAFQALGQKYNFSIPLENPLRYDRAGNIPVDTPAPLVKPAYTPADQSQFSPVRDDTIGRFDQVAFLSEGIPGFNVFGGYDSNADDNPYPASVANKPPILQYTGYGTTFQIGNGTPTSPNEGNPLGYTGDTLDHLNYWASGNVHGAAGVTDPSQELLRALELPSTWTGYLLARDEYAGATPQGKNPIAYFETDPVDPSGTRTVSFDGSFSRKPNGNANGLTYIWDFGDGTIAVGGPKISHTYSGPVYADVKLLVLQGNKIGGYRQAVPIDGTTDDPPATDPCGTLTPAAEGSLMTATHGGRVSVKGKEVER